MNSFGDGTVPNELPHQYSPLPVQQPLSALLAVFIAATIILLSTYIMNTDTMHNINHLNGSPGYALTVEGHIHAMRNPDVIVLGSSQGINLIPQNHPRYINLSREGGHPATWWLLRDEIIDAKPNVVLMIVGMRDHYASGYYITQMHKHSSWKDLLDTICDMGIKEVLIEREAIIDCMAGYVIPLYKYNHDLRNTLFHTVMHNNDVPREHRFKRNQPDSYYDVMIDKYSGIYYQHRAYTSWSMDIQHDTIDAFRDIGIRVVLLEAPAHPRHSELYTAEIQDEYDSHIASLGAEYLIIELGEECFIDLLHVNQLGRDNVLAFLEDELWTTMN